MKIIKILDAIKLLSCVVAQVKKLKKHALFDVKLFFYKKKTRKNAVCKRPLSAKQTQVVSGGRTRTYGLEIMSLTRLPSSLPRQKESIQPQVPLRLPCYDFTPVTRQVIVTPLKGETLSFFWKRKR